MDLSLLSLRIDLGWNQLDCHHSFLLFPICEGTDLLIKEYQVLLVIVGWVLAWSSFGYKKGHVSLGQYLFWAQCCIQTALLAISQILMEYHWVLCGSSTCSKFLLTQLSYSVPLNFSRQRKSFPRSFSFTFIFGMLCSFTISPRRYSTQAMLLGKQWSWWTSIVF